MSMHLELGSAIETAFGDDLDSQVEQKQDAMIVRLKNGVTLEVRYAAADAYSLRPIRCAGSMATPSPASTPRPCTMGLRPSPITFTMRAAASLRTRLRAPTPPRKTICTD